MPNYFNAIVKYKDGNVYGHAKYRKINADKSGVTRFIAFVEQRFGTFQTVFFYEKKSRIHCGTYTKKSGWVQSPW